MNVSEVSRVSKVNKVLKISGVLMIYALLFFNACILHDSTVALASAFCGITYTLLAGKGNPLCYIIGLAGSALYMYLAYSNHFWGNLILYGLYFVPMQIIGFFKWNKNLKKNKYEIIKTKLKLKENIILFSVTFFFALIFVFVLAGYGDANPVIDGFTTVFSVLGMYLTVRRAIEQWYVWAGVNALSFIMWIIAALNGVKAYSTVLMWFIYFILAIYFYKKWKEELA